MAMAVVYTNFAGQIVSENRGGTVREYVPDTLGSTTALATAGGITDTWDYWPYGEVMTRTGSTPTPFTFVGVLGYFEDLLDKLLYAKFGEYQPKYGRWLSNVAGNSQDYHTDYVLFLLECNRPVHYSCAATCRQIVGKRFQCCNSRRITIFKFPGPMKHVTVCCQRACEEIKCFGTPSCKQRHNCYHGFRLRGGYAIWRSTCGSDGYCSNSVVT